jgi:hypothetical protein
MNQHPSRAAATHGTTEQAPTPEQPVVAGCLYEAGFSTTGPHPHCGRCVRPAGTGRWCAV